MNCAPTFCLNLDNSLVFDGPEVGHGEAPHIAFCLKQGPEILRESLNFTGCKHVVHHFFKRWSQRIWG